MKNELLTCFAIAIILVLSLAGLMILVNSHIDSVTEERCNQFGLLSYGDGTGLCVEIIGHELIRYFIKELNGKDYLIKR